MKNIKVQQLAQLSAAGLPPWVRLLRAVIGVCLAPAVYALALALWKSILAPHAGGGSRVMGISADVVAFAGGVALFTLIYNVLPRPTRAYVLAHELTHAFFALLDGAKVGKITIRSDQGSVAISKTNTLTLLAPYFFPFYTLVLILAVGITACFVSVAPYRIVIVALIGFSWGFHLCFTVSTLLQHQTDLSRCGVIFSWVLIAYLNLAILALGLLTATSASFVDFAKTWWTTNAHIYLWLWTKIAGMF